MFNEPKNGDFASLVENLSSEKLEAIRQENEALFSSAASSNPESQRLSDSNEEADNRFKTLREAWKRRRAVLSEEETGERANSKTSGGLRNILTILYIVVFVGVIAFLEDVIYYLVATLEEWLYVLFP